MNFECRHLFHDPEESEDWHHLLIEFQLDASNLIPAIFHPNKIYELQPRYTSHRMLGFTLILPIQTTGWQEMMACQLIYLFNQSET